MLHLSFPEKCRICRNDFDRAADNYFPAHAVKVPKVIRRNLAPDICDSCWGDFSSWCAKRLGQERRKCQANMAMKGTRGREDGPGWGEVIAEETYGRFRRDAFIEWLADCLNKEAEAIAQTMPRRGRRYHYGVASKAVRRAQARVEPLELTPVQHMQVDY